MTEDEPALPSPPFSPLVARRRRTAGASFLRVRRAVGLWLVLFAAYAATLGMPAFADTQFGGDEPHYLLAAESIVSDGDVDLRDEYATRAYRDWYPYALERHGRLTEGRANEPHGVGFALLIAPAYALGGPLAVQLLMAAIAALALVLGVARARRWCAVCRRRRWRTAPPSPPSRSRARCWQAPRCSRCACASCHASAGSWAAR